jgi:hypothetical protein
MSIKDKLLEALELDPELLSDDRLLDLLLDAHARRQQRINELERERAGQQLAHQRSMEALQEERERARRDPLYTAPGEYFFYYEWTAGLDRYSQRFVVRIVGRAVTMSERKQGYDMMIQQVSREDFLK